MKKDILSLSLEELTEQILLLGEKKFRAEQIYIWLHNKFVENFDEMTNISGQFKDILNENFYINNFKIEKKLESAFDNTIKYLYELEDGNFIESVLMEYEHGNTICVSTQVGCKMGCRFCASTKAGFVRNLEPSEMLQQVYYTQKNSERIISNVVLMGIGEPLDNYDNVLKFLSILNSQKGKNLGYRHISLSTCGVVPKIYELADLKLGLTLSISLHATTDEKRNEIMPINHSYNIAELKKACIYYIKNTGRRVSFEYALIDGVNNTKEDAIMIKKLLGGIICHVNIIPVNKISEADYTSSRNSALKFQKMLENLQVNATVRRTLGTDIMAACGQLRATSLKNENSRR